MFKGIEFAHPYFFWLLLLIPLAILWYIFKRKKETAALKISSLQGFNIRPSVLPKFKPVLFVIRMLGLAALVIAMARPQTVDISTKTKTNKGIDIVMAIDVSSSMLARDLEPYRLEALKEVAIDFVNGRPSDRIDGTAIGMGLATSVNRLKESRAESKVIILLTDGVNNSGFIDPKIAAELAVEFGIKVYTIGIGTNGYALAPIGILPNGKFRYGQKQVEIDEKLLQEIADETGGLYFRATDNEKLEEIYGEINKLENTLITKKNTEHGCY